MEALRFWEGPEITIGCDEAGRGCLAGPVTAAAVILPRNFSHPKLNDSKKLSEKVRLELRELILKEAIAWHVAHVFPEEIDKINILNASFLAMHRCLDKIKKPYELILVDGNRFNPYPDKNHTCIIKGDGKYLDIAAASILAKTSRDAFMGELSIQHPDYQWNKNKGYPTKDHRLAIQKVGPCEHHRKSFTLLPPQLELPY